MPISSAQNYSLMMKRFIILLLSIGALLPAFAQKPVAVIGFYNVENLFDTEDDPDINDEDFLPEGSNQWTADRYQDKLFKLSKVIEAMAGGPDILGLCEIENRRVIEDLLATEKLRDKGYQIVHFDSPDRRGIDVALVYKARMFRPFATQIIPLKDPTNPDFYTRDMLLVKGLFLGDTLTVIVNHWPSRRGGKEDMRLEAGKVLRQAVDSIQGINPSAKMVLMGDFNDDPTNNSIRKYLRAHGDEKKLAPGELYNTSYATHKKGYGTLAYQGAWNLFDQLIISPSLLKGNSTNYYYLPSSFTVFAPKWMQVPDGRFKGSPFRSFSFGAYVGGYSDHYPVYMVIAVDE
jgi:predicted extracellular nuclease